MYKFQKYLKYLAEYDIIDIKFGGVYEIYRKRSIRDLRGENTGGKGLL